MSTPMMQQWESCKKAAKGMLLFFRMGDFYEAFHDDAVIIAQQLDLTLTKRQEIPMCGVPWHAADNYIDRLVAKGHKIAIAEQTEDPKQTKGLVKREIVRVVTPGTVVSSSLLSDKTSNYIAALSRVGTLFGLALLEVTTGAFKVVEFDEEKELLNELFRVHPSELVVSKKFHEKHAALFQDEILLSFQEEWQFEHKTASRYLTEHFRVAHLDGFGLKGMVAAINAAGALLSYVHDELSLPIKHIHHITPYNVGDVLALDRICLRNLELTESLMGEKKNTLLNILDQTATPMGGRLLREWVKKPLLSVEKIEQRQNVIEALYFAYTVRAKVRKELQGVRDLERLMTKVSAGFANPRDFKALGLSLHHVAPLRAALDGMEALTACAYRLVDVSELIKLLDEALVEEPPIRFGEGRIFKEGYHQELDELRSLTTDGKAWLARYQVEVKEQTGIKNLKVSYNRVFGYYIEVSKGQAHLMPESFQRRQTLVNSERFISPILKEYEQKVLTAEEKIHSLETKLFGELKEQLITFSDTIFGLANAIAFLDTVHSLAQVASERDYVRPTVDESDRLEIIGGRHPIIEAVIQREQFIPNDTKLDEMRLMVITGPNMAGKSTYIRQVALLTIMAQMGSFVPAKSAHIGVVDKIFTRIGANDDLSRGQSTFMVEMSETANILNNVTPRSLVILDEIGRGTSTYDGISIAWAVAEHLLSTNAKTLFATHYWELTDLEKAFTTAENYHAAVDELQDEIVFLHRIVKGGADKSYGIHVARLAGLPFSVISRAQETLKKLESKKAKAHERKEQQLLLF